MIFHSLRKKKDIYKSGTWRKSVLYLPKPLPLVCACVLFVIAGFSWRACIYVLCVGLSERTLFEYVGLVLVKDCSNVVLQIQWYVMYIHYLMYSK